VCLLLCTQLLLMILLLQVRTLLRTFARLRYFQLPHAQALFIALFLKFTIFPKLLRPRFAIFASEKHVGRRAFYSLFF